MYEPGFYNAALQVLDLGWVPVPMHRAVEGTCSCGGSSNCKPGRHPRIYWATSKLPMVTKFCVEDWDSKFPDSNIGIVTGQRSRLVVLDVDPRNGGLTSLNQLQQEHGELPETVMAVSGGGGAHYYFFADRPVASRKNFLPGLDLLADGSLVTAPPSLHHLGESYYWIESPLQRHVEELPESLETYVLDMSLTKKGDLVDRPPGLGSGKADRLPLDTVVSSPTQGWAGTVQQWLKGGPVETDDPSKLRVQCPFQEDSTSGSAWLWRRDDGMATVHCTVAHHDHAELGVTAWTVGKMRAHQGRRRSRRLKTRLLVQLRRWLKWKRRIEIDDCLLGLRLPVEQGNRKLVGPLLRELGWGKKRLQVAGKRRVLWMRGQ